MACESGETMQRRPRRNHTPAFKARVAFAAIKGEKRPCSGDDEVGNVLAPDGVSLRMRAVELEARGLAGFTRTAPSIADELRLRHWEQPNELAWPPPKPFDPAWFAPVPFDRRDSAEWWKVKEEEARAVRE